MKRSIVGLMLLASATSADAAETWTCPRHGIAIESMKRFTVSAPDTLDETVKLPASLSVWNTAAPDHYRIVQNDDYQLVATRLVYMMTSEGVSSGEKKLAVVTVAINKMTGEYAFADFNVSESDARAEGVVDNVEHGRCFKD
ncbi:MAG: hypothetical protein WA441_11670 [Methyloceanibacter sp.]